MEYYFVRYLILSAFLIGPYAYASTTAAEQCKNLFDNNNYLQAKPFCLQDAKEGNRTESRAPQSQTILGEIYDSEGNAVETAFWWKKAADAGNQEARNLLALKYFYGGTVLGAEKGWQQDYKKAFNIWLKDAEEGVATSQFMIGVMYQKGYGVTKDLSESWFWLKVSLSNGYKLATDVLIAVSRKITPLEREIGRKKLKDYQQTNINRDNGVSRAIENL